MDTSGQHTPRHGLPKLEYTRPSITGSGASDLPCELFAAGQILSERYKVISVLGCGGMGAVYKVEQVFLRQSFALKTLHNQANTDVAVRRFHKEAQAASKLSHPNLVRAHDFGILPNHQPFFVMDLVEGPNLSEYTSAVGTLPVAEVLDIFIPVCFGLGYAHEQGVIHRDIKPSNIMLADSKDDPSGYVPRVVDFGIAKFTENEEGHSLTLTGEVFGTPLYMSPEQCMGEQVDHRSDIYSLGCVMYEALTGAPPFHGDTALNLMIKHQTVMPPSMKETSLGKEFPNKLEAIIAKTLIKDPKARYQSLMDLARELASLKQELMKKEPGVLNRSHDKTVKDIPMLVLPKTKDGKPKFKELATVAACLGSLVAGVALGFMLQPKPKVEVNKKEVAEEISAKLKAGYEEALSVGHSRYLTLGGSNSNPMQVYKFPGSFDIGVFKYTHPTVQRDNSSSAQGSISVPFQSETYLKVPVSRLYTYPHLLRGFQASDLNHLHIANDSSAKVEDISFLFDASLAQCSDITGLKEVYLFGTSTTDKGISFIKDLPHLDSLDVSDTKVTPAAIKSLKNFPNMQYLGLKNVAGAKELVSDLSRSKSLRILNFANSDLTDDDLKLLSKIDTLQFLTVDANPNVTNEGIKQFKNLIALGIAGTNVTPDSIDIFKTMSNLRAITLSNGKWSAQDVQNLLAEMPNLTVQTQKLDANNRFTKWNWKEDL